MSLVREVIGPRLAALAAVGLMAATLVFAFLPIESAFNVPKITGSATCGDVFTAPSSPLSLREAEMMPGSPVAIADRIRRLSQDCTVQQISSRQHLVYVLAAATLLAGVAAVGFGRHRRGRSLR